MKSIQLSVLLMLLTASCNGWGIQPGPFNPPTPFLPPTPSPPIFTTTPVVIPPSSTPTNPAPSSTSIIFITPTDVPTLFPSDTPVSTEISAPTSTGAAVSVEILGCNTSIDVTHGMGEVTNAFVVVRNTSGFELTNLHTTLRALDEGREHPDKTVEVSSLLPGFKVNLKLTVDSTYQEETPIQVEVAADGGLFRRVGIDSCRDIGVFAPNPGDLTTPVPDIP